MRKEGFRRYSLNTHMKMELFDLAVLLVNIWKAAEDKHIGFEDSEQTIDDLTGKLNHETWVKISDVESALWSCNLLAEKKKFWHPRDYNFESYINKILGGRRFDRFAHIIERPKAK